jgi:hypothetical protein
MFDGRRVILFLITGAIFSASATAGLITQSPQKEEIVYSEIALQNTNTPSIADDLLDANLGLLADKSLPVAPADLPQDSTMKDKQILTEGNSSFSLCLSALIGFSLLGSTHWVKKVHIGFIPEWYHDGGPYQIGHSYAISPNCICKTPVACFIQPVSIPENSYQNQFFSQREIVSLWRNSQFTPDVIASRAPPSRF